LTNARSAAGPRVLVIDNYDSFTYNLVQYLVEAGAHVEVVFHDALALADLEGRLRDGLVDGVLVSPGPKSPTEAGISLAAVESLAAWARTPLLGVCLGQQTIAHAFGGRVVRAAVPMHGRVSPIHHDGADLFAGLPSPFLATRYHSLVAERASLPACLRVTAWTAEGEIMGLCHESLPISGVQFHPESVATEHGHTLVEAWVARLAGRRERQES
jgi:anthranilate synthase/aminodeoxychorismate synthase-like glutamine amidotransferase